MSELVEGPMPIVDVRGVRLMPDDEGYPNPLGGADIGGLQSPAVLSSRRLLAMQTFNGMHQGDLEVTADLLMAGTVTGDLVVLNGQVLVQGVVWGRVHAIGGVTDVHGRIGGASGNLDAIRVAVGACVAGRVLRSDMQWYTPQGTTVVRGDAETYPMSRLT